MWPSQLCYDSSYSYDVDPETINTLFASRNTRQRNVGDRRDDIHSVKLRVNNADLQVFENFVINTLNNGADEYTGPYFVGGTERTGTLQIINGEYQVRYLTDDFWEVNFNFLVKNRSMTFEDSTRAAVIVNGGFTGL